MTQQTEIRSTVWCLCITTATYLPTRHTVKSSHGS